MEESNVMVMTPQQLRNMDKSQIASMTMTNGDVIVINHDNEMVSNEFAEENVINQNSYQLTSNLSGQNYILRTKKEKTVEEGDGVEKVEETVEIEVEPQPETAKNEKGEVLRGPDGKPLLNDILTGNIMEQEQPQTEQLPMTEENLVPQQDDQYYEQPGVPEQNVDMNNNGYDEQLYPPEDQNNANADYDETPYSQEQQQLYPQEMGNQEVPEQYVDPNYDNNYPPEFSPMPNENVPQEGYQNEQEQDEYYQPEQPMNMPEEHQGYYPEEQPQDYEPQDQQGYYPEEQPQPQDYQQPMNVPQEQQGYYPEEQPPQQQPLEQPVVPVNQPPLQEPIQPPTQLPVQEPIQPPTQPQVQVPIQPQPMQPVPVQPTIPKQHIPGAQKGKGFILPHPPKMPKVPIGMGRGLLPKPHGPMVHPPHAKGFLPPHRPMVHPPHAKGFLPPHRPIVHPPNAKGFIPPHRPMVHPPHAKGFIPPVQQKKIVIITNKGVTKGNIVSQIGQKMNMIKQVMTPKVGMVVSRVGLRSTKPTTEQKDVVKQENVLRARRVEVNEQQEGLCPKCANEEYFAQSGNVQYSNTGFSDNYTFHEIVETSDNSKSYVVAKKGGITVSSDY